MLCQRHPLLQPLRILWWRPTIALRKLLAGIIIPPIPEKNPMQKIQTSPRFLRERRTALEKFINRVVSPSWPYPAKR